MIAGLERIVPEVLVYTQNVDGLHTTAGSSEIIEIHGNLRDLHCTHCRFATRVETYAGLGDPPLCPKCLAPVRPAVVLFGEALPEAAVARLEAAFAEDFDIVFSIGTSSLFPYIVQPVLWAQASGAATVEINPAETVLSAHVDFHVAAGAAEAMGRIWHALLAET